MRPVYFPTTTAELLSQLRTHPGARVMAGGTDLLVRLRQAPPDTRPLFCLEHIDELRGVSLEGDSLCIAAATSLSHLAAHPLVLRHSPLLAQAAATLGGPALRTMASLGGNICTASPAGDTLPALLLYGARLALLSSAGLRQVLLSDFITGPGKTLLQPGEILTLIQVPIGDVFTLQHFEKVGRRQSLAISVASLAALLRFDDEGCVAEARLAWGSVAPTVFRCPEAEAALVGQPLSKSTLEVAALCARRAAAPIDDIRASADHRRRLTGNLLFRLLPQPVRP